MKTEDKYICNICYVNNKHTETPISIHPLTSLCEFCNINQTSWYIKSELNLKTTPCCKKEMKLKLAPDYSSSGIWCFHCGCNLYEIGLPNGLQNLCGVWNDLWDHQINDKFYWDDEYFGEVFISTGEYLSELISQYCYCEMVLTKEEIVEDIQKERRR